MFQYSAILSCCALFAISLAAPSGESSWKKPVSSSSEEKFNATKKSSTDGPNKSVYPFLPPATSYSSYLSSPPVYTSPIPNAYFSSAGSVAPTYMQTYSVPAPLASPVHSYQFPSSAPLPLYRAGQPSQPQRSNLYDGSSFAYAPALATIPQQQSRLGRINWPFTSGLRQAQDTTQESLISLRQPGFNIGSADLPILPSSYGPLSNVRRNDVFIDDKYNLKLHPNYLVDRLHASGWSPEASAGPDSRVITFPTMKEVSAESEPGYQVYMEYDPSLSATTHFAVQPHQAGFEPQSKIVHDIPELPVSTMMNGREMQSPLQPFSHEAIMSEAMQSWYKSLQMRLEDLQSELSKTQLQTAEIQKKFMEKFADVSESSAKAAAAESEQTEVKSELPKIAVTAASEIKDQKENEKKA